MPEAASAPSAPSSSPPSNGATANVAPASTPKPTPAPAAPAPPPANGASGLHTPAPGTKAQTGGQAPPASADSRPRGPDGKFLPRADGTTPTETAEGQTQQQKEEAEWRFREKLKVYGKEEEVDYSREDLKRELQIARADRKRLAEAKEAQTKAQRLFELAQQDPEAFLKELGQDPDAWARQRLAQEAKLNAMTPEERAIAERDRRIQELEAKEKQREEQAREFRERVAQEQLHKQIQEEFTQALAKTDLGASFETLYLMAETKRLAMDAGRDLSGEELARETERRVDTFTQRYLGTLSGPALAKKLGPERVKSLIEYSIAEFEKEQSFEPPAPEPVPEPEEKPHQYIDEHELNRRMRALQGKG